MQSIVARSLNHLMFQPVVLFAWQLSSAYLPIEQKSFQLLFNNREAFEQNQFGINDFMFAVTSLPLHLPYHLFIDKILEMKKKYAKMKEIHKEIICIASHCIHASIY